MKANKGQTRFNKSPMQSYEKQKSKDDEGATTLMFTQIETRNQEQIKSPKEVLQAANECLMQMAEASVWKMQEAMMAVT